MARCLITGHKGYIGSRLYESLKEGGHEVMGIDIKDGNDILEKLKPFVDGTFHPHWTKFKPEYIFHLAAIPRVAYSMQHPYKVLHNNIMTTLDILEFARRYNAVRVIYSSSSSVRGNGSGPTSPYGASKLIPETLCKNYSKVYDLDTVCLRYFNVYSSDQEADGPYATAIANWMKYIQQEKDPFITGDGKQRRDMLHVNDAVSANIFCMNHEERFSGNHYDVGTGENVSLNEVREIVLKNKPHINFEYVPSRPGDVNETRANTEPLSDLGWEAQCTIQQGIHSCFNQKGE